MSEEGRYIKGGDGSHWVGCEETHWDCKIARLEKENTRLQARIAELEAENGVLRKMHKEAIAWGDKGWSSSSAFQLENERLNREIQIRIELSEMNVPAFEKLESMVVERGDEIERLQKEVEWAKVIINRYLINNKTGRTPIEYIEALNWVRATK